MVYEFIYVFVGPKTCHTFFCNTSLSIYTIRAQYYITYKTILLSLPFITYFSVIPFHQAVWPNNCDFPTITIQIRRWPLPFTFWHCWFPQMTGTTDMFYWLHQVWLFVVASTLKQYTVRLLVVTKCLCCLDTVNHKFSITHSASNWTSSVTDAYITEQLYMSCCMHWGFGTCRVQQTETNMW